MRPSRDSTAVIAQALDMMIKLQDMDCIMASEIVHMRIWVSLCTVRRWYLRFVELKAILDLA